MVEDGFLDDLEGFGWSRGGVRRGELGFDLQRGRQEGGRREGTVVSSMEGAKRDLVRSN